MQQCGDQHRSARCCRELFQHGHRRGRSFGDHEHTAIAIPHGLGQREELRPICQTRRHWPTIVGTVGGGRRRRQSDGTRIKGLIHQLLHASHFVLRRRPIGSVRTHHKSANRRVPHEGGQIHGAAAGLDLVHVFAETDEIPADARLQAGQ